MNADEPSGPKEPQEFDEVTAGTDADATDTMPENVLPVSPEALGPEVIDQRHGMFGVRGSGDTSGYAGVVRSVAMPGGSQQPYGGWFDEVAGSLESALGPAGFTSAIEKVVVHRGEITFFVRRGALLQAAETLRNDPALRFEFCSGVSGVHYPNDAGRELHAVYHLLSMTHNRRIRLEVTFDGYPSLTRIQMPDDWPGHPQRKDYPLGGIPAEYKGATIPPPDQRRSYT